MKIRTGFVSNSSSSSFTCQVCGSTESGMDMSMDDFDMSECENGHIICNGHKLERDSDDPTPQEKKSIYLETLKSDIERWQNSTYKSAVEWIEENKKEIKLVESLGDEHLDYFFDFGGGSDWWNEYTEKRGFSSAICPICQFKVGTGNDLADFALSELGWTREETLKVMQIRYKEYTAFRKAME